MTFSTKNRNAVNAMLELMLNEKDGLVTLSEISEAQGISMSYLEQLFAGLRKHKLVQGARGPGGGYQLGKSPAEISIADIHFAVEGAQPEPEIGTGQGNYDAIQQMWSAVTQSFYQFLDSVTLEGLAGKSVSWERRHFTESLTARETDYRSHAESNSANDGEGDLVAKSIPEVKTISTKRKKKSEKEKNAVPDELWAVAISGLRVNAA